MKANARDHGAGDDEVRAEPVFLLSLVKHDLESANGEGQQAEPDSVNASECLAHALEVGRIFNDAAGENDRQNAHRNIEEEDPAPGVVVGDPAADGRSDGRSDDDGHAVDGEGDAPFFGRKSVGQDGALAGLQAAAGRALKDAEDDQQSQRVGKPATERKEGEGDDATHVEALAADAVGDPAADGENDGVRDQVRSENPGRLVVACAERPGDVRKGNVGNRGIERFHECGERDSEGDNPRIEPRLPRLVKMKFAVGVPRFRRRGRGRLRHARSLKNFCCNAAGTGSKESRQLEVSRLQVGEESGGLRSRAVLVTG